MSVHCKSANSIKMVRLDSTPDYIPTITTSAVVSSTAASGSVQDDKSNKTWGKVKNIAQIRDAINWEKEEEESVTKPSVGIDDFHKAAKLFIKSKQLVRRARSKYGSRAMKMLHKRQSTQAKLNVELFGNYSLVEMHEKIKRQRQLKLVVLQKRFLDQLPELKERSVKEHLERKVSILEKIRNSSELAEATIFEYNEEYGRPASDLPTRRQSRLRRSIDLTNGPIHSVDHHMNVPLTILDLDREIAVARSRGRIESDLSLPDDRMARLFALKANVDKINTKFQTFTKGNKKEKGQTDIDTKDEVKPFYAPSRFVRHGMAIDFFRKHARLVLIVTQWINMIMNKQYDFEKELKSFIDIATEIEDQTASSTMMEMGLQFDKKYYKANREISLSLDARKILTTAWQSRTPDMIKQVMNGLQSLRSLSEYPVRTQEKLCKVAWYQTIGPKKAIIRQGHHAESFYFILSGTAFVKKNVQDPVTGETKGQVAARLTKGHSFGEIGLLFDTLRTATVESATAMELLVINKEDFVRIFMKAENPDDEADHIKFIRKIPFMSCWPVEVLKAEPGACLTHYFKRGNLITDNDRHSEWIYIIMSGSCEVLKKLKSVTARDPREIRIKSDPLSDIILPELGMPNNHAKINTGRQRTTKATIHPEVFQDMTNFYDSLRQKHKPEPMATEIPPEKVTYVEMPQQADTQLPKLFIRSSSASKVSDTERVTKVRFLETKQKTESDIPLRVQLKLMPAVHENTKRPVSRAKFDDKTPKMQIDHFIVPSPKKLNDAYRPLSRDADGSVMKSTSAEEVFVKVELLQSKDLFGLNTLKFVLDADDDVFDVGDEAAPILSLVSRGAEVIMLSKKVFLKYADQRCRMHVRDQIKVYPSEEVMQSNMQKEADWGLYRENTLSSCIKLKHLKQESKSKSVTS